MDMASSNDDAGRIHKKAFIVSNNHPPMDLFVSHHSFLKACNLSLFILCLLSVIARFYIRLRIQRQFSTDDGFLLFGAGCLVAAIVLLFLFADTMYMAEAILSGLPNAVISPNLIQDAMWFHKIIIIALILTWWSLMAVKICFLFLFKKMVERMKPMLVYWWIVTIFNILMAVYGSGAYVAACPHFNTRKSSR